MKSLIKYGYSKWAIYFFVIALISKILIIYYYGNSVPYWDQWDGEADIYKWYLEDKLTWKVMIGSFNEHRILLTRVLGIALLEINNRIWDPKIEMYFNGFLHIFSWIFLLKILLNNASDRYSKILLITFSTTIFIIPFGFENTLAGFQSQFYLMIMLTLILVDRLLSEKYRNKKSWVIILISILLVFTMASGVIALISSAISLFIYSVRNKFSKKNIIIIIFLLLIAICGIFATPIIPSHDNGKAHSFTEFILAIYKATSWPVENNMLGLIVNLPLLIFVLNFILSSKNNAKLYSIFCLALWVIGQYFSASYMRAIVVTTSRYLDVYSLALPINLICIILLMENINITLIYKNILKLCYVIFVISFLIYKLPIIRNEVITKYQQSNIQELNVTSYLCSHDIKFLENKAHLEIPYPDFVRLKHQLDDCNISKMLKINKCSLKFKCENE